MNNIQSIKYSKDETKCKITFYNNQEIIVNISNIDLCCEKFGLYIMQNKINVKNRLNDFIEKEMIDVDIIIIDIDDDIEKKVKKVLDEETKEISFKVGSLFYNSQVIVRLTLKDEEYPLDFVLFNEHNGYYPHGIYISFNLKMNEYKLIQSILSEI